MSPILVRPVREQLEHDRVIRLLQARSRRRFEVGINPGAERNTAVGSGPSAIYPDLVLTALDRGRRLQAVIEVETTESVNNLEALSQWAHLGRMRTPFHLYVPAGSVEVARRLCSDNKIAVAEIWSYHLIGDQMRFTMVHRAPADSRPQASRAGGARPRPAAGPSRKAATRAPARHARPGAKKAAGKPPKSSKSVRTQKRK